MWLYLDGNLYIMSMAMSSGSRGFLAAVSLASIVSRRADFAVDTVPEYFLDPLVMHQEGYLSKSFFQVLPGCYCSVLDVNLHRRFHPHGDSAKGCLVVLFSFSYLFLGSQFGCCGHVFSSLRRLLDDADSCLILGPGLITVEEGRSLRQRQSIMLH